MRQVGAVALVGVGVLVVASCSDGEDSVDLDGVEADVGETVELDDRQVVSISPTGVVVIGDGEELCVQELDGNERGCVELTTGSATAFEPSSWSADGQRLAFGARQQLNALQPTSISVLDTEDVSIDVVVKSQPDGDDRAPLVAFPTWASDTELRYLRSEIGDDDFRTELVTVDLDGDEVAAVDVDDRLLIDTVGAAPWAFGDRAVYVRRDDAVVSVLAVDDDGGDDRLVRVDGTSAGIGGIDERGERMVVTAFDPERLEPGPAIYLETDRENDEVESPFDVVATALDPTGSVVAAASTSDLREDDAELVLWDPATGDEVELGAIGRPLQLVWTDDDRIVAWNATQLTVVTLSS